MTAPGIHPWIACCGPEYAEVMDCRWNGQEVLENPPRLWVLTSLTNIMNMGDQENRRPSVSSDKSVSQSASNKCGTCEKNLTKRSEFLQCEYCGKFIFQSDCVSHVVTCALNDFTPVYWVPDLILSIFHSFLLLMLCVCVCIARAIKKYGQYWKNMVNQLKKYGQSNYLLGSETCLQGTPHGTPPKCPLETGVLCSQGWFQEEGKVWLKGENIVQYGVVCW
jgi:hypothetical protein